MSGNGNYTNADEASDVKAEEDIVATTINAANSNGETKPHKTGALKTKLKSDNKAAEVPPATSKSHAKSSATKSANGDDDDEAKEGKMTPIAKSKRTPVKNKRDPLTPGLENGELAAPSTPKQSKRYNTGVDDGDDDAAEPSTTPRKRRAPNKPQTPGRSISTRIEDASAEDKMLMSMKDDGKSWAEIRKMWKVMTGEDTGSSTLPNRYNRLKTNFISFRDEDEPRLLAAKAEVEKAHEVEFWNKVASVMGTTGADKYPAKVLEKKFKELQKKGTEAPTNDAKDVEADNDE